MFRIVLQACGYEVVEEEGEHDITSILFNNIQEDIKESDCDLSEYVNFKDISIYKLTVRDLFNRDMNEVLSFNPLIKRKLPEIDFIEISGDKPQIQLFMNSSTGNCLITVDKNFLPMIHMLMAITQIMIIDKTDGVLNKNMELVMGKEYDELALYVKYTSLLDLLYKKNSFFEDSFEYFHNPFDLCEIVKGVRKFVIFHEISHIRHSSDFYRKAFERQYKGYEEYVCDTHSIKAIMNCYPALEADSDQYEFRNAMKGIQMYLILLAKIENYHSIIDKDRNHPFAYLRLLNAFTEIIHDEIFDKHIKLQYGLVSDHFRLKLFYLFSLLKGPKGEDWKSIFLRDSTLQDFYIKHQKNFVEIYLEIFSCPEIHNDIYKNYMDGILELIEKFHIHGLDTKFITDDIQRELAYVKSFDKK